METAANSADAHRSPGKRINKHSPIPLYHQLEAILREQISRGEFKPNDRLPAEQEIAAQYDISKVTVRQALSNLAATGIVRREQGRGTFVAEPRFAAGPRELTSFSQEMRQRGLRPSSVVLERQVIPAHGAVAEKLGLREGDRVYYIRRLRLADGIPMGIQTAYIHVDLAPNLLDADLATGSLYEVLEQKYGLVPRRAREVHLAVAVAPEESRYLCIPAGSPALAAERVTFADDGRVIELVRSVMRGDRYQLLLDLVKTE